MNASRQSSGLDQRTKLTTAGSSRLGPYELVAPLGEGGMGVVYRARDTRLDREVAIKVLPEAFANDANRRARFEREAKAVAALSHPNILAIHDYGTHESVTYSVMELLEGETLRDRLTQGPLPWREAIEVVAAVAEGLAAAHEKRIVHRDLKPENLFLTADGRVKILDFGLARVDPKPSTHDETDLYMPAQTDPGTVMGTAAYMAPEQVRGQPADARSDLFSLGSVLYEMLTGRRAFDRQTAAESMTAILREQPPDPINLGNPIPPELVRLTGQCLAKSSRERPHSARDLALALRAIAIDPSHESERLPVEELVILPFKSVGHHHQTDSLVAERGEYHGSKQLKVRPDGLKVRPLSSIRLSMHDPTDLTTLGRTLNAQVVLSGTLHQVGDDLWLRLARVDAHEDTQRLGNPVRQRAKPQRGRSSLREAIPV
jgi:serine/threonine protein kinase